MAQKILNPSPVRDMTALENSIFNEGERLVPGVSHNVEELRRHVTSYLVFKKSIMHCIAKQPKREKPYTILDLGCGCGWGSAFLAQIPNVSVTGVDIGTDALEYAKRYYKRKNTDYFYADITEYVTDMPEYDFIVSRNMIEHVPNGLEVFHALKWREMLLIDVPYLEAPGGNPHHLIHHVDESTFANYPNPIFLYQDLVGTVYAAPPPDTHINIIFVLCQREQKMTKDDMDLPIQEWRARCDYAYYDPAKKDIGNLFGLLKPFRIHE